MSEQTFPIKELAERYLAKLQHFAVKAQLCMCADDEFQSHAHLAMMCDTIISGDIEFGKANRWLGYIQGVFASIGIISIEEEIEYIRSLTNKGKNNE